MGKRLRVQRRGRGTSVFRASTHKRIAPIRYPNIEKMKGDTPVLGVVDNLSHEPGRGAPLASIRLENGERYHSIAVEGLYVGQEIAMGSSAPVDVGNILPLGRIASGTMICNIESQPGDGGKFVRASGAYATVVAHTSDGSILRFPSGKVVTKNDGCRATVGVVSGAGRTEKPFMKAGNKYHQKKAKGHTYPTTRGVAMIKASHPHGGGRHQHAGTQTSVGRTTPPGRKVGLIAPKQTGRAKRRRR